MKAFLEALQKPLSQKTGKPVPEISPWITEEEYLNLFNSTSEGTGSHRPSPLRIL